MMTRRRLVNRNRVVAVLSLVLTWTTSTDQHTCIAFLPSSSPLLSTTSSSSARRLADGSDVSSSHTRRKKKKKSNNSNKKRRRNNNGTNESRTRQRHRPPHRPVDQQQPTTTQQQPPPTTFAKPNHDPTTTIGCEHFDVCAGCVVDENVGSTISVIDAARRYFASPGVLNKILQQDDDDDEQAFTYSVIVPTPLQGWRTQAKLAVAPQSSAWRRNEGCVFGLYKERTHDVLPIPNCAVHHPSINRAVRALEQATAKVGTVAYSEQQQSYGDDAGSSLRYVQFQVERSTGKICLTLVWRAEHIKQTQPALSRLVKQLAKAEPELWHSIWCHCNDGVGNNIFARNPKRWYRLSGPEFLREPLPVRDSGAAAADGDDSFNNSRPRGWLYFTPFAFRQGNMDGFDRLAIDVAKAVPGGSKVCELYAGVGVLGLTSLAYHHHDQQGENNKPLQWIRCSDENPANPRCFQRAVDSLPVSMTGRQRNRRRNGNDKTNKKKRPDRDSDEMEGLTLAEVSNMMMQDDRGSGGTADQPARDKTSYCVASAAQALLRGEALGANVLIVDPPRKGLEDTVLDELCKPYNPDQPYMESAALLPMDDSKVNWTNDVQTLIYVSCGFDALARDCERLLSSPGGWMIERATGYILFPGSDHVESLCIFQRK